MASRYDLHQVIAIDRLMFNGGRMAERGQMLHQIVGNLWPRLGLADDKASALQISPRKFSLASQFVLIRHCDKDPFIPQMGEIAALGHRLPS
ncbi:MAG: hypothetical protein ABS58_11105 [Mesorhizobium sp. SCN 65-20]|nr:MAG: hypothetical protein ABS58_11105 [Mesorhizobium sp. SCN 65-20]